MLNLPLLIMGVIGFPQLLVIVGLIVILFGGKKIPELMRGMGRGIKEFKDAMNKDYTEAPKDETTVPPAAASKSADETTKSA